MNFLNPEEILEKLEIRDDMIVADFGCGSGGFTFPIAKKLKNGFVYALDIQESPLSAMKGRAEINNITNIDFINTDIEKKTNIAESSLDLVIIVNVLFQIEDKKAVISEAKRLLKKEGKIVIIDWEKEAKYNYSGQSVDIKEIKKIAEEINISIEKEFKASPYHYGIILKR